MVTKPRQSPGTLNLTQNNSRLFLMLSVMFILGSNLFGLRVTQMASKVLCLSVPVRVNYAMQATLPSGSVHSPIH